MIERYQCGSISCAKCDDEHHVAGGSSEGESQRDENCAGASPPPSGGDNVRGAGALDDVNHALVYVGGEKSTAVVT